MLTLNDGRSELWQWDTGRTLAVDADCSQVHFSNKVFGRSIDVDVVDGAAIIPDILLQTDKDLNVWAFVGTAENGYTKISKTFKVNRRNKPADYVFTPTDQTTLAELVERLDRIEETQDPEAIKNAVDDYLKQNPVEVPVQSVNGQTGAVELNAEDVGAIAETELQTAINTALAQAKASGEFDGADGAPGKDGADGQPGKNGTDGYSPTANVTQNDNGAKITITDKNGTTTATITNGKDGADGEPGPAGEDGGYYAPAVDDDGNLTWTASKSGMPAVSSANIKGPKGYAGADGQPGADGKSAYQYAQEGGYAGTEEEFAEKLAEEMPDALPNPNPLTFTGAVTGSYDGSAPLTVEMPSGGSVMGGCTFCLEAETTEDVSAVNWSLPINWDKIIQLNIYADVPRQDADLALYAYFGGTNYKSIGTLTAGVKNGIDMYILRTSSDFCTIGTAIVKSYPENAKPVMPTQVIYIQSGQNTLRLYSNTSGVNFPVGAKFVIWGVYVHENP